MVFLVVTKYLWEPTLQILAKKIEASSTEEAVEKMRSDPDPAFREGVLFEIAK
jgi:hypothetical protein